MSGRKTVQVPAELHKELKMEAVKSGETIESITEKAIKAELEKRK